MSTVTAPPVSSGGTKREVLTSAVIRFCGDSGDGMQVTGSQFTNTAALFGNDLSTFPDFPAEIRAPQGTLPGVSGFQVNFSSTEVHTPGDAVDVLIAMNPAALKTNVGDLKTGGILIVNSDSFGEVDFKKAKITSNPLEDGSLSGFRVFQVDLLKLTKAAVKDTGLDAKSVDRSKNFFALGMCYWLFGRSMEGSLRWIDSKFKGQVAEANKLTLRAGYAYCEATEAYQAVAYEVAPARLPPGTYRNLSGNTALSMGLIAGAERSGLPLFLGSYPITPASDILHELSMYKSFGVVTFQAEDEIAAVTSAIGAAYGGHLATTTTSGPGMALKMEAIGLAIAVELPLVVVDIQRGGPSTGLPTKTEQADLFQAIFGRNSEAPLPVLAPATPGDCFWVALEACRIAVKYMTPVIVLSDGYLANGAEPWRVPTVDELPSFPAKFRTDPAGFQPFMRDPGTLARPWAVPGTAGLEHRIGGIEKQDVTGNINYEPENHDKMVRLRAAKVAGVVQDIPDVVPAGDPEGDVVIVGWGSTYCSITAALHALRAKGHKVGHVHLRHLNPMPKNVGEVLKRYKKVLVPEINLGQLAFILRGTYLVDAISFSKVEGKPFKQSEIENKVLEVMK
ncbi:MAG: 2-oxoacid:acceptor oxidoreductase subunit alpha [Vicinamibacteria bacterium]|nr:2-oxoacid:acceptor oxidoreductase subunit alpha [Vicinamibacteria bacterium]